MAFQTRSAEEVGPLSTRYLAEEKTADFTYIAAIDFGTTFSGYAYSHRDEQDKVMMNNNWGAQTGQSLLKTPTAILFDGHGKFKAFGFEAEQQYSDLVENNEEKSWMYFHRFKMTLKNDVYVTNETMVEGMNGARMKAVKIFSSAISYLVKHLLDHLRKRNKNIDLDDIKWVLTVPAIWGDRAKQFMRKAAEMADIKVNKLLIALEPECASIYCQSLSPDKFKDETGRQLDFCKEGTKYIVLDNGGGTVDVAVHQLLDGGVFRELHKASGGGWGGTCVDDKFFDVLNRLFGANTMRCFKRECPQEWVDLQRTFEMKKRAVSAENPQQVVISMPELVSYYKENGGGNIEQVIGRSHGVTKSGNKFMFSHDLVVEMFDEPIQAIIDHLKKVLRDLQDIDIQYIFLVGGFSESDLMQSKLKAAFPKLNFVTPDEAGLTVVKGAVMFGFNPDKIATRKSRFAYGVRTSRPFNSSKHKRGDGYTETINGELKAVNLFSTFVSCDEDVSVGDSRVKHFTTRTQNQKAVEFDLYRSETVVQYVTESDCERLATIEIKINKPSPEKRDIDVTMYFGKTEIEVRAKDVKSGKEEITKVDFQSEPVTH